MRRCLPFTSSWPPRVSPARTVAVVALAVSAATSVGACGSSSSPSTSAGSKVQQSCTAVADILSDGPDPTADPVGYAQAQVLPLRQLQTSDAALEKAVKALASAYQAFSAGNGSGQSATQVNGAEKAVNAICPGAAQ